MIPKKYLIRQQLLWILTEIFIIKYLHKTLILHTVLAIIPVISWFSMFTGISKLLMP